jgi:exodeoxyribonuclease VII large subunit
VRASTPTDAAKRVVPDVTEELDRVTQLRRRTEAAVRALLDRETAALGAVRSRPVIADPHNLLAPRAQEVAAMRDRARRVVTAELGRAGDNLAHTRARVTALSPAATLERGYAVLQRADGTVVRRSVDVAAGDALRARLAEGEVALVVGAGRPEVGRP